MIVGRIETLPTLRGRCEAWRLRTTQNYKIVGNAEALPTHTRDNIAALHTATRQ